MSDKLKYACDQDAIKIARQHGNNIENKNIYLKAKRMERAAASDMPGVTSAGLKMWSAIDYLVNYKGYTIVYEVPKEEKKTVQQLAKELS
jgi:hypothetical protein